MMTDVLVIGAGLAGLVAGWQAALAGRQTRVMARGWGIPYWHSGCLDVLGYTSTGGVDSPAAAIPGLVQANPRHPYARVGLDRLAEALAALQTLAAAADYPLMGSLDRNWLLPSTAGAARPTCLAPETMTAGSLASREPMLIAGLAGFGDFYPEWAADNLDRQGVPARPVTLALPSLAHRKIVTGPDLARLFDTASFREEVAAALRPHLAGVGRVGFPAVLGLARPLANVRELQARLDRPVFEIPGLPPSIPGMRLHRLLVQAIGQAGGQVLEGMPVTGADVKNRRILTIRSHAAGRPVEHRANFFILATGGILGGGITGGDSGPLVEEIFNLPLAGPAGRFQPHFLAGGHPLFQAGVEVNSAWQPVDGTDQVVIENLGIAGGGLAHWDGLRERSLEGVAVATGYLAGRRGAAWN